MAKHRTSLMGPEKYLPEDKNRAEVTAMSLWGVYDSGVVRAFATEFARVREGATRPLVVSLRKTLAAAVELHAQGIGCPDCPPDHEDTGADCPMLVTAEAALAKAGDPPEPQGTQETGKDKSDAR